MSGPSLQDFSRACCDLYAPGLNSSTFAARSFAFIRRLVSAEFIACGTLNTRTQRLDIGFDLHHAAFPAAMEALGALMPRYALFNWDPSVNAGRPFSRSHFYSEREFRDLDVYQEVYRPLGIDNHCAVYVPTGPGEIMFFGIERAGGPDFSSESLQILELAQAQLSNAHALARLAHETTAREDAVELRLLVRTCLTPREAETLFWMARGKSNAEIAIILGVSVATIKDHASSLFDKTGSCNRHAASAWARRTCRQLLQAQSVRRGFVEVPAVAPSAE